MGLRILPGEFKAGRIGQALRRLHEEPSFREAAGNISRKLRSRRITPRQEAAGEIASPGTSCLLCLTQADCESLKKSSGRAPLNVEHIMATLAVGAATITFKVKA